ncbi:response regulator [Azohydromonas australica]|uniref:response regulator n=1 Tax=Azohydromonas australica TaxID=364039 RepID=UPI0003F5B773|nr:response regulator [Azohydromonas australica]
MDLHSLSATAWPDPQPSPAAAPGVSPALEPRADTDALARVQDETERVLDAVPRALQRLRRGAAPAEADPATVLQLSVRQMQQVAGALRITGFEQAARLPAAVAELLAKAAAQAGPPGVAVVEGVEHACAALRTYLRRWRAGRPLSALALYPAWNTLQTLSGAERIHPAELWPVPWQWHALPPDERMPPLQPDGATRGAAEQLTLALMRDARSVAASRLSDLFAALARGAADGRMATLWGLASAMYEGQAKGLLAPEVHLKRVSSRLLAQLRRGPLGTADAVAQRLAHDLLFFCAQAGVQAQDGATPRLAGVRRTWGLERHPAVDVEHALPAGADAALLAQTLRQLAAVQALWDAAAAGTPRPGQREALSQMAQSLRQLLPRQAQAVEELTQTLQHVMAEPGVATSAVPALEVAQSLLALQLLLQEHETETAAEPLQCLSTRIAQALSGAPAETGHPEVPVDAWLLELAQRGAERQALTALGQSLRTALNEAGLQLDALAQGPDDATLRALAQRLQRLQGVLTVLSQPELASSLQALREALPAEASALDGAQAARLARRLARLDLACERLTLGLPPTEGLPRDEELDAMEAPAAPAGPASAPVAALPAAIAVPEILTEAKAWAEPGLPVPPVAVSASAPAAAAAPVEKAAATPEPELGAKAEFPSGPVPDLSLAPQPPLLTERPELPALTEPALPPGVEAGWDAPAAELPELVDVTQLVTLHQSATDDERIELASLLKHVDAQGAAMAPTVASPPDQAAAAPLSSRLVALSRLGGAPALPPVASEPVAAAPDSAPHQGAPGVPAADGPAPSESTVAEEPAQPHEDAGAQASTLPATWDEPALAGEAAGPGAETAVAEAPSAEAAPVAEPPADEMPASEAGAGLSGEDDAVAAQPAVAAAEAPWPEADAPAAVARTEAPADAPDLAASPAAPPAAEEDTLWSDTEARAWLDTEAGSWAEAGAGDGDEPDAGSAAVPPAQAPSAAAPGLPDWPKLPDLPDLSDLPGLPALPELPELPDGLPPAEGDGLSFDLSFDLPPAPQAPAFPLAAADEAFGGAEPPPAEQEGADFDLDFGPGLPGTDTSPQAAVDAEAEEEIFLDMGEPEEPPPAAGTPAVPADAGEVRIALPGEALPPAEHEDAGFDLDFDIDLPESAPAADMEQDAGAAPAVLEPPPALEPIATAATLAPLEDEHRLVGPLRVSQSLFDIYIEEAEALSGRLHEKLWQWQPPQPLERELVVVMHALAGMAATVGDQALWQLARTLEDTMAPCRRPGYATPLMKQRQGEGVLRVREMLTLFASGTLPEPVEPAFLQYLRAPHEDVPTAQNPFSAPVEARSPFGPPPQSTKLELPDESAADEARAPLPDKEQGGPDATAGKVSEAGDEESLQWLDLSDVAEAPPASTPAEAGMPADDVAPVPDLADEADETGEDFHETVPAGEPWDLLPAPIDAGAPAPAAAQDDLRTLDPALFPVFEDEAQELLPQLAHSLSAWAEDGGEEHAAAGMRTLHTLKGGARLAGAMRLGDAAHALESAIEALLARSGLPERTEIEALLARADALAAEFERLRAATTPQAEGADAEIPSAWADADADAQAPAGGVAFDAAESETVTGEAAPEETADAPLPEAEPVAQAAVPALDESAVEAFEEGEPAIDWSRFAVEPPPLPPAAVAASPAATVRVRAPALDRLVAQAGEVGISRARLVAEMQQLGSSLADLDENLQRLRGQLREVEQQAETRLDSGLEAAPAFDALEMDRSTRLQELARMMAESLDDMASVQHSLRQGLRGTDDELVVLARLAGELQDELLRTRLVAFDSLAERLQRVLRQAAQEAQRQVRLDIEGGEVEIDRGVLERMTPAFEHLLRNAVVHGIEPPAERFMRGKPTEGRVLLRLAQEGAQVSVSCSDDGRGLDLQRIQRRAVERGLLALEAQPDAAALQHLVFAPGFSTAERLSPLAGRGVGLDVVRAEVEALGGHIVLETTPGQGSRFTLQLPLTTAVMQVLLLRCGEATVAVPAALVDEVLRVPAAEARQAAARGRFGAGIEAPVFHRLEPLLQWPLPPDEAPERMVTVLLLRGAQQRLALQVQEVLGRQEAVLKPLGPQLATLPGLAGMSLLPSGLPLPVYNPAALALRHTAAQQAAQVGGGAAWGPGAGSVAAAPAPVAVEEPAAPLVLVVDDSLTVRRATQRLLEREGYRVALAKDGVEALALLEQEPPALVLTDLEMPRLDGFELLRRLRAEPRWQALPVIVITSRRAPRHRELAASLGVEHYLGKPCAQEELLALVAGYSPALQAPN